MADTPFVGIEHKVEAKYTHKLLKHLFFLVDEISGIRFVSLLAHFTSLFCAEDSSCDNSHRFQHNLSQRKLHYLYKSLDSLTNLLSHDVAI